MAANYIAIPSANQQQRQQHVLLHKQKEDPRQGVYLSRALLYGPSSSHQDDAQDAFGTPHMHITDINRLDIAKRLLQPADKHIDFGTLACCGFMYDVVAVWRLLQTNIEKLDNVAFFQHFFRKVRTR